MNRGIEWTQCEALTNAPAPPERVYKLVEYEYNYYLKKIANQISNRCEIPVFWIVHWTRMSCCPEEEDRLMIV